MGRCLAGDREIKGHCAISECCETRASARKSPKKVCCPVNGKEYHSVGLKTILHHLTAPWSKNLDPQPYYFCSDPECDIVYFGLDQSVITKSELRTSVGLKETPADRIVCYCFGVTYALAENSGAVKDFVRQMTKQSNCTCEISNPSGRCCLKDFPKH